MKSYLLELLMEQENINFDGQIWQHFYESAKKNSLHKDKTVQLKYTIRNFVNMFNFKTEIFYICLSVVDGNIYKQHLLSFLFLVILYVF